MVGPRGPPKEACHQHFRATACASSAGEFQVKEKMMATGDLNSGRECTGYTLFERTHFSLRFSLQALLAKIRKSKKSLSRPIASDLGSVVKIQARHSFPRTPPPFREASKGSDRREDGRSDVWG